MIKKRGIKTVTGLGRHYRKLDQYKTGILDQYDLEGGLKKYRINLTPEVSCICSSNQNSYITKIHLSIMKKGRKQNYEVLEL